MTRSFTFVWRSIMSSESYLKREKEVNKINSGFSSHKKSGNSFFHVQKKFPLPPNILKLVFFLSNLANNSYNFKHCSILAQQSLIYLIAKYFTTKDGIFFVKYRWLNFPTISSYAIRLLLYLLFIQNSFKIKFLSIADFKLVFRY